MTTAFTPSRTVSAARYARLERAARKLPRLALVGDRRAARHEVLNLFLEGRLDLGQGLPANLPLRFSYGEPAALWIDKDSARHPVAIDDLAATPGNARLLWLFLDCEMLIHCDIVDAAVTADDDSWRLVSSLADVPLWCLSGGTPASPAEAARIADLSGRRGDRGIAIVTDAPGAPLTTAGGAIPLPAAVALSPAKAMRAIAAEDDDIGAPLWEESGAAELMDLAEAAVRSVAEARIRLLDRYVPAEPVTPSAGPAAAGIVRPNRVASSAIRRAERPTATDSAERLARLRAEIAEVADIDADDEGAELQSTVMPFALRAHAETRKKASLFAGAAPRGAVSASAFGGARRPFQGRR